MNWVDLLIVLLAVLAAVSGARQGMVVSLCSVAGVLAGAMLGLWLAPLLVANFADVTTRVAIGVALVVLMIALGEMLGVWVGRPIKEKLNATRLTVVDNSLGAVTMSAVVFVVAWLLAVPLTSAAGLPALSSAVKRSTVLGVVDDVMPPAAQSLPGSLRQLLDSSGFPAALDPFASTPRAEVGPPDLALQTDPVVQRVRASVLKVRGRASSCARALEGTGFVIAPQRVMTNAHVVAGTDKVTIEVGRGDFDATVVLYDPQTDVAILDVPDLKAPVLPWASTDAKPGEDGVVVGYPLDGPYTPSAARVRDRINLRGPDIYEARTVVRDVYTIRAKVRSGNSGGPLIDPNGRVLGVVFGAAVDDHETGFVLTAKEVADELAAAPRLFSRVSTGTCTN
ncbi:MarP family serine protease [Allokutzneria albata]|uniref:Colicin V production protein n=1 Tax=Allokutzneria albata TaxID=211114 RepID=A0A1H0AJX8_ALLAB|nr:MarP family serine protease [Allokutzneria albata]SDN33106.1 Colicin V production protein [Allokutzneria albata]